jgi:hypothetical protein
MKVVGYVMSAVAALGAGIGTAIGALVLIVKRLEALFVSARSALVHWRHLKHEWRFPTPGPPGFVGPESVPDAENALEEESAGQSSEEL